MSRGRLKVSVRCERGRETAEKMGKKKTREPKRGSNLPGRRDFASESEANC